MKYSLVYNSVDATDVIALFLTRSFIINYALQNEAGHHRMGYFSKDIGFQQCRNSKRGWLV